jgi:hypothetical protein
MNDTPDNLTGASDDDLQAMGLPANFTLESLQEILSKEEIAALAEGDDPLITLPEGHDAGAGEDDEDDLEGEKGDDDEGDADPTEAGNAKADDASAADTPDPVYAPTDVSAHKATIEGYDAAIEAVQERYSDGELTDAEFRAEVKALTKTHAEAERAVAKAEDDDARAFDDYSKTWYGKVDAFLDANPAFRDNTAVPTLGGHSPLSLFDGALRHITGHPEAASLSMSQKIAQAEQMVRTYVMQQTKQDLPAADKGKPAKPDTRTALEKAKADAKAAGKRPDALQTLRDLPAATEPDASRYSSIDNLDSDDAEAEFERMSPEEREQFLKEA